MKDLTLLPWWAVEHPYRRMFFQNWVPGCVMPGCEKVSGSLLERAAEGVVGKMKKKVQGRYGTGQCDGWKNVAKTSLITLMVNVEYLGIYSE